MRARHPQPLGRKSGKGSGSEIATGCLSVAQPVIAVVGAGPVGTLAALEISRHGHKVILIESRTEISWTSRAICISRRSLEILDRAGVGEAFIQKGLPWSKGRTFHGDQIVFRLDLPYASGDRHAPFINLQQSYAERFLHDAIRSAANGPELRSGDHVTAVCQTSDGARLEVESASGRYELNVDWVVACDGARSTVRSSLGLSLKGSSYEGRYLISDIEVEGVDWPVERHVWFDAPANPGSTVILHVQPDGIWRVDIQLREGEDPDAALEDANLLPRLQAQLDMMGVTQSWRLVWKSLYRAHSVSLDSYRHGRVLFAGDAAHLVPIFGVRGLNSGFDDAHNLAWKLAFVASGKAPEQLLDSYSSERRRATAENIANADRSTWFMSPPSPGFRKMRDAALVLAHEYEWARSLINPRQSSFHIYDGSPIVLADNHPNTGVRPGAPVPNLPFGKEGLNEVATHLQLELAPRGFTALLFEEFLPGGIVDAIVRQCASFEIKPLFIGAHERAIINGFAASKFPLYLIRPDEHVAARFRLDDVELLRDAFAAAIGHGKACAWPDQETHDASPIEDMYEALSRAIDKADVSGNPGALERVALSLANEIGDVHRVRKIIEDAMACGSSGARAKDER